MFNTVHFNIIIFLNGWQPQLIQIVYLWNDHAQSWH